MVKQLEGLFTTPAPCGAAAAGLPSNYENLVFEKLDVKFTLIVFSCVQIASKLCLHSDVSFRSQNFTPYHSWNPSPAKV